MKVTIKEYEGNEYPCIKRLKAGNYVAVALFFNETECTILHSDNPEFLIGHLYNLSYPERWKKFNGKVILQND